MKLIDRLFLGILLIGKFLLWGERYVSSERVLNRKIGE